MNIYDELRSDHQRILSLLDELIASDQAGPAVWEGLVRQLRDELIPHARAEEAILYNALRDIHRASSVVVHAYGEHAQAEAVLRGLQVSEAVNVSWVGAARQLRKALQEHILEEETRVFTEAGRVLSEDEANAMGNAFRELKVRVREQSFVGSTLDLIANMLPARLRPSVRRYSFTSTPASRTP